MKTFLKKNMIWIFALVLGIGTMSLKMVEKSTVIAEQWYEVDLHENIGNATTPPSGDCREEIVDNICKIKLDTSNPIPPNVAIADALNYTISKAGRVGQ